MFVLFHDTGYIGIRQMFQQIVLLIETYSREEIVLRTAPFPRSEHHSQTLQGQNVHFYGQH